jgi:hypothetical protein
MSNYDVRPPSPAAHPIHATLMKLHMERRKLLLLLEGAVQAEKRTEDIVVAISENRGATRVILAFLNEEVLTRPVRLTDFSPL